ncbi:hypothetical protein DICPUDRAFT_83102 [Dictyostelium purpureum]|uniref:SPRY domain-containing protein n=1 Tax=Dictyostelium purpureum TaxID=5786 RepID=F0ZYJ3_DICPU|nr:uncharacterized protein DICPUDRAFT_83102 [Dictyostelium purpureum]EGC30988.1 hypothetical protein DICPUDRAFT_83102 [Dictyostelium purpureum]|eukprot:XP_003292489.1 hypothetical protein DICPUDRAFT_83102 [Dictyostelium purpureum]
MEKRKRITLFNLEEEINKNRVSKTKDKSKKKETNQTKTIIPNKKINNKNYFFKLSDNYILNGSSLFSDEVFYVNSDINKKEYGSIFCKDKIQIGDGIKCEFSYQILEKKSTDSFYFIIHSSENFSFRNLGLGSKDSFIVVKFTSMFSSNDQFSFLSAEVLSSQVKNGTSNYLSMGSKSFSNNLNDSKYIINISYNRKASKISIQLNSDEKLENIKIPFKIPSRCYFGFAIEESYHFQKNLIHFCNLSI